MLTDATMDAHARLSQPLGTALVGAIARALEPRGEVQAAFLFGSHAQGVPRAESDIDVAVLLDRTPTSSERKAVLQELLTALGRELRADRIDLVILNDAPPKLAFQILKHGRLALLRDEVALHRFRVRTYSRHADYEPIERWFRQVTKRRAQGSETKHG